MAITHPVAGQDESLWTRARAALVAPYEVLSSALGRLMSDDGWALASHLALAVLLAIFPFLIFVTALAGFFGVNVSAGEVQEVVFEGWPDFVSGPIAKEVHTVLTTERHDLLTFGILLTIWFSSNGVEALRVALERAYGTQGARRWWVARLLSIGFALVGGIGLLFLLVLVVLGPTLWDFAARHLPWLLPYTEVSEFVRYGLAALFLTLGLLAVHLWLPVGRRRILDVMPGIGLTLVLWLGTAGIFGYYIANFSSYATTYAGLAGIMAAIVFLNLNALCFILGAEINAAILARRARRRAARATAALAQAKAEEQASAQPTAVI